MKKILLCFTFCFFIFGDLSAKSYSIGSKISDHIELYKKYKFELPPGEWIVADRYTYERWGFYNKGYILLKLKNKIAEDIIMIGENVIPAKWIGYVDPWIVEIVFKDKYDGCYQRPEYYVFEFFAKGSSFNCFWVYHLDLYKELFDPDDPYRRGIYSQFKGWLRDNSVELPKVTLGHSHWYFSRLTGGKWFYIVRNIDPKTIGAPKNKYIKEDRSEYHPHNISQYPKHKKSMEKMISIGAERHKKFELEVGAKDHHKLELNNYINLVLNRQLNSHSDNNIKSNDILSQLKNLNELYKSGVLTKEEFKKAKDKVLNQ